MPCLLECSESQVRNPLWGAPGGEVLGGQPLPRIAVTKELAEGFQPLLLAEFTFIDGSLLRCSSENWIAPRVVQTVAGRRLAAASQRPEHLGDFRAVE
jgi:hypothetical protein